MILRDQQLTNSLRVHRLAGPTAAGGSKVESGPLKLDFKGSVVFVASVAVAAPDVLGFVSQSTDGGVTWTRVSEGSSVPENDGVWVFDLSLPRASLGSHVQVEFDRGTNTAIGEIYAFEYNPRVADARQTTGVSLTQAVSPPAGGGDF